MKKLAVISAASLFFLFGMLIGTSFGGEVTLFGPNQYVRVGGDPDVYTNSFTGIPGTGKLIVKNGNQIGDKRIEDAISGAVVKVNGEVIFGPSDFNQNIYYLEADIDLLESNTLYVELMSKPGSYITLEVTEDVDPPTVSIGADPYSIYKGGSSTLSWTSSTAESCTIEPDVGDVDVIGYLSVSPTETTTYKITATGLGGTATGQVTVTLLNRPPVADSQSVTTDEDAAVSFTLTGSDPDDDPITFQVASGPSNGTISGTLPNLIYSPNANFNGSDALSFLVNDGKIDSAPSTVSITVAAINDPPTAANDSVTTDEDTPITVISVLANDGDVDGDTVILSDFTQPAHGTVGSNGDGTLSYTPGPDFNGTDSFTYTIGDGNFGTAEAVVTVTVNPVNDAPVAADQSPTVNEDEALEITLIGTDVDGDVLTYNVATDPAHGTLTGTTPNLVYTPQTDYNGSDSFTFTVNDGQIVSAPASVSVNVSAVNDPPTASAGADQTVKRGDIVSLDGSGSNDIDGDSLTYQWSFVSVPPGSSAALSDPAAVNPTFVADGAGSYQVQLVVSDAALSSTPDTVAITAQIPMTVVPDVIGLAQRQAEAQIVAADLVLGSVTTKYSETVPADHVIGQSPAAGASIEVGTPIDLIVSLGTNPIEPPTVTLSASPGVIAWGESATLTWTSQNATSAYIDNGVGVVSLNGSEVVAPDYTTTYTISVTGATGSASAKVTVTVNALPAPQPEGSFGEKYQDLVPPDATLAQYDPERFSLITGLVQDIDSLPLANVAVHVLEQPAYGTVYTDADGRFSIPAEGGGNLTAVYRKEGYIAAQRKVYVPWNDVAEVETLTLISEDPLATSITFDGNPLHLQTHRSTVVTDESGSRSATLVFGGDNRAFLVNENGSNVHELSTISVRATEYTTPESMPAKLPPTSAFTYCVELTVEGAERVRFEKPVTIWVDNFLDFPVGVAVPVGYYDRDKGVWVPLENGVVVQLLDTEPAGSPDGVVDAVDADGDGLPDDIDGNGSFANDVQGLDDTQRHAAGSTFWRAAVTHFSPIDLNFPFGAPTDAVSPNSTGGAQADTKKNEESDPKRHICSFVEEKSRIFHEDIPIPGTDMNLHYASNRVTGYKPGVIYVPASGDTVPESLVKIIVRVNVAGRKYEVELPPEPNQAAEIEWDGLDYLGRAVTGSVFASVQIGFVYNGVYYVPANVARAFGQPGTSSLIIPTREPIILWQGDNIKIFTERGKGTIAEGWTISSHHHVNIVDPTVLYKGDGSIYQLDTNIITTVAGTGNFGSSGDGGPAIDATFSGISDIAVDNMGNLYIADHQNHRIRKVDSNGIITTVAGNVYYNPFPYVNRIAVDDSGNIYVATGWFYTGEKVYKVAVGGNISAVVGGRPPIGTQFELVGISGLAVDRSGNLYISTIGDVNNTSQHRVLKVDTSGGVTTVAGTGVPGFSGDGGLAINARLNWPRRIAVDSAGNLYISDSVNHRIRKVDTSGIITTYAGSGPTGWGSGGFSGDGEPAVDARLNYPSGVAVDNEGSIYISSEDDYHIRKVDANGIITTVAGTGVSGFSGDGGPAIHAQIEKAYGTGLDALGNLYVGFWGRARKISTTKLLVPSMGENDLGFPEKNGLGHIMDASGRHKRSVDLKTGATLSDFSYDTDNNLVSITDQFGNQITIERNSGGDPTAIISPFGVRTELTIDGNNHLTRITYPDGDYYDFEYAPDGLLILKTQPAGNQFGHVFDANGRITDFTDDEGGHWQFSRSILENGDVLHETLTGENNLTSYVDSSSSSGAFASSITEPSGALTQFASSSDGLSEESSFSCGEQLEVKYDYDSEYKFKYIEELKEIMPSGLQKIALNDRAYYDDNSDGIADRITETVTINGKASVLVQNISQSIETATSPGGRVVTLFYDPTTLAIQNMSISGLYDTALTYDSRGRITSQTTNTRQTTLSYLDFANGHQITVTDPEQQQWIYNIDPMDRLNSIRGPDGGQIQFVYDKNGNMTVLANPLSVDHGFGFNSVNRNSTYQTPLSGSYRYTYDRDRRLVQTTFPSGKQINNIFTDTRLTRVQTPEGHIDYSYLCGDHVGAVTKGAEAITYGYDGRLLTSETLSGSLNQSLQYTYNNDFDVAGFSYAGGTAGYSYDGDGLLTGAGGYAITRNAGNGLPESVLGGGFSQTRSFNGYGELDAQNTAVNGAGIGSWSVTRYNSGRIVTKTETAGGVTHSFSYTYDEMGRLLAVNRDGALVEEYDYNANGTRIYEMNSLRGISGRSYDYDAEDHLLTAGTVTYSYDLDGFLSSKTDGANVTTYDYSSRSELLGVNLPDGRVVEYVHDPLGRRIEKKIDGVIVEKYLWQGLTRLLAVYDGSDNLVQRFEYADSRMPVAMTMGGARYFFSYDQVGSLRAVANGAGNVVKLVEYDAFGNVIADSDPAFALPFGFAGGLHDRDIGLVRFGYRDYDPDTGRWTAKDPILFAGGNTDFYGYVVNNPVNLVDPWGLKTWQIGIGFNAGGIVGSTKSAGIIIGHNPRTGDWDVGFYATGGAGLYGGASASLTVDVTTSDNPCIDDVSGWAGTAGGSVDVVGLSLGYERNTPITDALPSNTYSFGVGTGTPAEGHGFGSYTKVWGSNK